MVAHRIHVQIETKKKSVCLVRVKEKKWNGRANKIKKKKCK